MFYVRQMNSVLALRNWHCEIRIAKLALRNSHCEIGIAKFALRNWHCEIRKGCQHIANLAMRNFAKVL